MENSGQHSVSSDKDSGAAGKTGKRSSGLFRSSKLYLPLLTTLGLVLLFAFYAFFYVSSQEAYYNEHAFRVLTQLGESFQENLQVIQNVLAASTSARYSAAKANAYVSEYLGKFEVAQVERVPENPAGEPNRRGDLGLARRVGRSLLRLQVKYSEGGSFSSAAGSQTGKADDTPARSAAADVNLEPETRKLFDRLGENFFDDLIIAESTGNVLYQQATSIRLSQLNPVLKQAETQKPSNPPTAETDPKIAKESNPDIGPRPRFAEVSAVSNVIDVKLAGEAYKLYLLPLAVSIRTTNSRKQEEESKLILCGLRSTAHVRTEALALPYTHLIWASIVLLAAVALIWPVLKISYMSPKERLRHKHVVTLVLSTFFATVLLTLTALNLSYNARESKASETVLRSLAKIIKDNVATELSGALGALDTVSKREYLLDQAGTDSWQERFLEKILLDKILLKNGQNAFNLTEKSSILAYPYFRYMFWLDEKGDQHFKISVSQSTPQANQFKQTYFQDVLRDNLSVSRDRKYRFRLQPATSPNTGEFLVVLAKPFASPEKELTSLKASVLVSKFESLVDPVIPSGYGFAVVNSVGRVQFHSNSSRNLIEDFAGECRPNTALLALLSNASEGWINTNYMGRRRSLYVTPLEDLGLPSLSLIVFRDTDYFTTLNMTIVLVFAMIVAFYAIPFVLAAIALIFKEEYPLEMIWPCMAQRGAYVNVAIVNLLLAVTFFASYRSYETREALVLSALVGFVGGLFAFLEKAGGWFEVFGRALVLTTLVALTRSNWILLAVSLGALLYAATSRTVMRFVKRTVPLTYLYALSAVSILAVVVVAPCCGFFELSYNSIQQMSLEREQLILARRLAEREDRVRNYYDYELRLPRDEIKNLRLECALDRHDYGCLNTHIDLVRDIRWNPLPTDWFQGVLANTSKLFPTNQMGAELRELALSGPVNVRWMVGTKTSAEAVQYLALEKSPFPPEPTKVPVISNYPAWEGLDPWGIATLAVTFIVLGAWIFMGIKKVFLVGLENSPRLDYDHASSGVKFRLIMGHPKSGKSTHARRIPGIEIIDIGKLATLGNWELERPLSKTIGLDRFEFDIDNPKTNAEKLRLLEELIYVEQCSVVILSMIDPMFYLASQSPASVTADGDFNLAGQLLDRWASVLSLFHRLQVHDKTVAQFDKVVENLIQKYDDPSFRKLAAMVAQECCGTAQLRNIGVAILKVHRYNASQLNRAKLLEEVLDRSEVHYRVLWSTCTKDERLVLFQLAQDGWANPNNDRALSHLQRRNLIQRSPAFRIMSESFRRFILHAQYPHEIEEWEREEKHSLWKALKLSLITATVLIGCWLLYAQQEVLNLSLGYISAFAAAGGIIIRLFTDFRNRGTSGSASK